MAVDYRIGGPDQIGEGVRIGSNLVHRFTDEQPRVDPLRGQHSSGGGGGLTVGNHGRSPEMGATTSTVLRSLQGFFLRLWNDTGNSFHEPWAAEMSCTEWAAAMAFFTLTWLTSRRSSGQPSASRTGREACQYPPLAPMRFNSSKWRQKSSLMAT
jgi:hypothetical protein